MKIVAVIPVMEGVSKIEKKNLRPFGDTTLLELKIKTLKEMSVFDDLIVATNSEDAIEIATAKSLNCYRCDESDSSNEYYKRLGENIDSEFIAFCPASSPLIKADTISKCISLIQEKEECDCVTTVSPVKSILWRDGEVLNGQDSSIIALNFGVTITSKESLISSGEMIGNKPLFVETDRMESINIDSELDFFTAEQVYRENPSI